MGRIHKHFSAENARGRATGVGKVDTGADHTVVRRAVGEKLGLDFERDTPVKIGGVGGKVVGFQIPAKITIGRASAQLHVVVPIARVDGEEFVPVQQKTNLIGHDFLQATKARIDFSRPHRDAFVGGEARADDVVVSKPTPAEVRRLREWMRAQTRRDRPAPQKSDRQVAREIDEALTKSRRRR